jgi:Fic family protein
VEWLAGKVLSLVAEYPQGREALQVAELRAEYLSSRDGLSIAAPDPEISVLIQEATQLQKRWQEVQPLDPAQQERLHQWLRTLYTYESNRIEGNTLTLQETEMVIHQGLTIGGKTMREHLEAINHAAAVDLLLDLVREKEDFSPRVLRELHSLILSGIAPRHAGRYRQVPVRISGSRHTPPQPWELDHLMEDYFAFYHRKSEVLHPVILAAEMHERLVTIHPFIDGNGRTSRLVMNLILLRHGYTLVNLKGDPASRLAYYQALEAVQTDNRPEVFHRLILEHALASLEEHLALV